jgi:hypothetical protein
MWPSRRLACLEPQVSHAKYQKSHKNLTNLLNHQHRYRTVSGLCSRKVHTYEFQAVPAPGYPRRRWHCGGNCRRSRLLGAEQHGVPSGYPVGGAQHWAAPDAHPVSHPRTQNPQFQVSRSSCEH